MFHSTICSYIVLDVWRFNPAHCPTIFEVSEDMRHIKKKGTGLGGTNENEWNIALCSMSTQRSFAVRILHNDNDIEVGMFWLDGPFHNSGYRSFSWTLRQDYKLERAGDSEMEDEFKGKKIPEGAVVSVHIDDKRRTLTFKVNGEEVYNNVKTSLTPEKFSRLVGGIIMFRKDGEVEIIDSE